MEFETFILESGILLPSLNFLQSQDQETLQHFADECERKFFLDQKDGDAPLFYLVSLFVEFTNGPKLLTEMHENTSHAVNQYKDKWTDFYLSQKGSLISRKKALAEKICKAINGPAFEVTFPIWNQLWNKLYSGRNSQEIQLKKSIVDDAISLYLSDMIEAVALYSFLFESNIIVQHMHSLYAMNEEHSSVLSCIKKYWVNHHGDSSHCPLEGRLFFDLTIKGKALDERITSLILKDTFVKKMAYRDRCTQLFGLCDGSYLQKTQVIEEQIFNLLCNKRFLFLNRDENQKWNDFWNQKKNSHKVLHFIYKAIAFSISSIIQNIALQRENGLHLHLKVLETNIPIESIKISADKLQFPCLVRLANHHEQKAFFYFFKEKQIPVIEINGLDIFTECQVSQGSTLWLNSDENHDLYYAVLPLMNPEAKPAKPSFFLATHTFTSRNNPKRTNSPSSSPSSSPRLELVQKKAHNPPTFTTNTSYSLINASPRSTSFSSPETTPRLKDSIEFEVLGSKSP